MGEVRDRLATLSEAVETTLNDLAKRGIPARLWAKDSSVWKDDDAVRATIDNRLGWLDVAPTMLDAVTDLSAFATEMRDQGFRQVLLLGMGGSSLCPEVLQSTFGDTTDGLQLRVLDSTDPDSVRAAEVWANLPKTCFIVASKSGSTIETRSFYEYFEGRGARGGQFVAITDAGSELERLARDNDFARAFINPSDIGGRYSALSYFGLVPAALIGIDVGTLLRTAVAATKTSGPDVPLGNNPAFILGAAMAEAALDGRDKLTLISSPRIATVGGWIEQLVAESTGKEGLGVVPIDNEQIAPVPSTDRLFVYMRLASNADPEQDELIAALEDAGHPTITYELNDILELGEAFLVWELATAVAGHILGINPFDEPNVKESKDLTSELLEVYKDKGALPDEGVILNAGSIRAYADTSLRPPVDATLSDVLQVHFDRVRAGDFIAVLAYADSENARDQVDRIRTQLGGRFDVATTVGMGPRFLHSTGQLFKGGPNTGVFLQILHTGVEELEIPNRAYGFQTLKEAQAIGDFRALDNKGRRVVRVQIGGDLRQGLQHLLEALPVGTAEP